MDSSLFNLLPTFTVSLSFCVFVSLLLEFISGLLGTGQLTYPRLSLVDVHARPALIRVQRGREALYGVINGNPFFQPAVIRHLHDGAADLRIYFAVGRDVINLAVGSPFIARLLLHAGRLRLQRVHRGVEPETGVDGLLEVANGVRGDPPVVARVQLVGVPRLEFARRFRQRVEK